MTRSGTLKLAPLVLAFVLSTAAATRAQGRVWRVAPSGADFTQIGHATAAARPFSRTASRISAP